jgi:hypothetical protein
MNAINVTPKKGDRYGVRVDGSEVSEAIKPNNILIAQTEASKEVQENKNAPGMLQKGDSGSMANITEKESYQKYIAQVWFSTTWSKGAENAVRKGLSSLLSSPGKAFETDVRSILEHWHNAKTISLKDARAKLQALRIGS